MTLKIEISDRLATVTVNRPDVRNALSRQVLADLRATLTRLRADDAVGATPSGGAAAFLAKRAPAFGGS
jgi:enoyl-CoA hydratase/carnithine racemase